MAPTILVSGVHSENTALRELEALIVAQTILVGGFQSENTALKVLLEHPVLLSVHIFNTALVLPVWVIVDNEPLLCTCDAVATACDAIEDAALLDSLLVVLNG